MGVGTQRNVYVTMAKQFLDGFCRFTQLEKTGGIGVPEIMKSLISNSNAGIDFF
jgi:hypothetical protein